MKPQTHKPKHEAWETMRSNWVNGNRSDVIQAIANMNKRSLIHVIQSALFMSYSLDHQSGDLVDLMEILKQF